MGRTRRALAGLALFGAVVLAAHAFQWGPYLAEYVKNYDGDTVTLRIAVWPDLVNVTQARLYGVDAPEIRGKCERERERARAAKAFVQDTLTGVEAVFVTVHGFGKYGRPLVSVDVGGADLAELLLEAGHARAYTGGVRLGWCGEGS